LAVSIISTSHLGRRKELSRGVVFGPGFHVRKTTKTNKQIKWHVTLCNTVTNISYIYTSVLLQSQKVILMW
jgi:hypothetical protein